MTSQTTIDLDNANMGYEDLARILDEVGADWKYLRDNGCQGFCSVQKTLSQTTTPQVAFDFPEAQIMENGQPTSKFGVYAGIYEGIKQTAASVRDQLGKASIEVLSLAVENNKITFVLGERRSAAA